MPATSSSPAIYSMTEVLGADDDRLRAARARGRRWCRGCCAATRRGARASPSRAPAATSPSLACRAGAHRRRLGASTARRSGRASPSTPSAACCSTRTGTAGVAPTAASPRSSSTWTRRGSPCGRSRRCTARTSSPRCSSTTSSCPSTACSATRDRAGRSRWTSCPTSGAPRFGSGSRSCTGGSQQLRRGRAARRARSRPSVGDGHCSSVRVPRPVARDAAPAGRGRAARRGDVDRQGAAGDRRAGDLRPRRRRAAGRGHHRRRRRRATRWRSRVPLLAGGDDLRRHRRDPAQHHRPAPARPRERP